MNGAAHWFPVRRVLVMGFLMSYSEELEDVKDRIGKLSDKLTNGVKGLFSHEGENYTALKTEIRALREDLAKITIAIESTVSSFASFRNASNENFRIFAELVNKKSGQMFELSQSIKAIEEAISSAEEEVLNGVARISVDTKKAILEYPGETAEHWRIQVILDEINGIRKESMDDRREFKIVTKNMSYSLVCVLIALIGVLMKIFFGG